MVRVEDQFPFEFLKAGQNKSDRLEIQEVGSDCSDDRIWPNPCLREVGYEILKDQLVTAERARQGMPG